MAFCYAGLAALSWFRLWFIGTANLDGLPMYLPWEVVRRTIIFALMSGIGISFIKLLNIKMDESRLDHLLFGSLILLCIAAIALPLTSNDIFSNLAYGKMELLGLNASSAGASLLPPGDPFREMVSARWMNMPMVYGPVIGWMNRMIVQSENLWLSMIIYKVVALALSSAAVYIIYSFCRRHLNGEMRCNSFILVALNPVFIWELAAQAHNDVVMVIGILGFVYFMTGDHPWAALTSILFAFVAKLAVLPVIGLYFCYAFFVSKRRFIWLCVVLVAAAAYAAHVFADKIDLILVIPSAGGIDTSRLTGTPLFLAYKILKSFGPDIQAYGYKIFWAGTMTLMAVLGICFAWRTRGREQLFLQSLLFILLFNLIASPTYQPWYILWALPFALAIDDSRLRSFLAFYSVISVAQYAILNSISGAIINLLVIVVFWFWYLKDADLFTLRNDSWGGSTDGDE